MILLKSFIQQQKNQRGMMFLYSHCRRRLSSTNVMIGSFRKPISCKSPIRVLSSYSPYHPYGTIPKSSFQPFANSRRLFFSTYQQQHDWEEEKEGTEDDTGSSSSFHIQISKNGQEISVTTSSSQSTSSSTSSETWTFAAPILWVNDPMYIHPTSGQRLRTVGKYSSTISINNGEIIIIDDDNSNVDKLSSLLHPPPIHGSYHPRGGIYDFFFK